MKKVLIVDDDRATSAGMADVVEEWGYDAEVADTVKAGWNSVSKMVPDVAIVDLKLPDGSGLDLLHRIKQTYPDVSVVILTGHATVDSAVKALKVGAEDYVTKPVDLPRLQVILKSVEDKQMMKQEILELRRQLRRDLADAHRVGNLRTREGRLHERHQTPRGLLRSGQGRHGLPRRNHGDADRAAGQTAARARRRQVPARRRQRRNLHRSARHCRLEPRSAEGHHRRQDARGS